jgi:hypothetical protein
MGLFFMCGNQGVTPVAGTDFLVVTTAANVIDIIRRVEVSGEVTAAAVNRMGLRRHTTNTTGPTAQTPAKGSMTSPAMQGTVSTTATSVVDAAAPALWQGALEAFGGYILVNFDLDRGLYIEGATVGDNELGLQSISGTSVITDSLLIEEI